MPRFFCEPGDISENTLILREDAHHITHVLRRVKGDAITVCDGAGTDFDCIIAETGDTVRCDIVARKPSEVEPALAITLVQGLPKADKMEWIIQKNTELGVSRFIPLFCERSLIKLDPKKKNQKEDRWQKIALSGAKQSGRGLIPTVEEAMTLDAFLKTVSEYDAVIVLYEDEKKVSLKTTLTALPGATRIALLIGPEGGWAPEEIAKMQAEGVLCAGLGPRILRTETAGMTAVCACLYHYNEME